MLNPEYKRRLTLELFKQITTEEIPKMDRSFTDKELKDYIDYTYEIIKIILNTLEDKKIM